MSNAVFWNPGNGAAASTGTNGQKSGVIANKPPSKVGRILVSLLLVLMAVLVVVGVAGYFAVVRPALAVKARLSVVSKDIKTLQDSVTKRDIAATTGALDAVSKDLTDLKQSRDANFGWARNFGPIKSYYDDSDRFIQAGAYLVDAGKEVVKLVEPFADAVGLKGVKSDKPEGQSGLAEAFASWISIMPKVAADMDPVLLKLSQAGKELANVDAKRYPEKIGNTVVRDNIVFAQTTLTKVNDYGPDIKRALTVVPGLLGVGTSEKRYMIIMQNDKEIRATGGFWTNYATFKLRNALLDSDFSSKDMYSVDLTLEAIDAYYTFPVAPAAYSKYLKVEHLYARDANISPDFPTAVDKFMFFYKLAMPINPAEIKPVDGVFAIDTEVVKELLAVTGPVTVNGVTYTSDNVVLELEKIASLGLKEQAGRKKVLGNLMQRMLINVFESDRNLWPKLIEKGVDLATRKHIVGYFFTPEAQVLMEKYNLAGRIVDPIAGDYLYVVSTNLGGDKTNWFVKKDITNSIAKVDGKWQKTVTVKYTYKQPGDDYAPFVKRFRDWVRVYTPLNSQFISVDGSEDGTTQDQERNKTYFTGYVELGPGETKEMTFKYTIPNTLIKDDVYNLYLEKQPGTNGDSAAIVVNGQKSVVKMDQDVQFSKRL